MMRYLLSLIIGFITASNAFAVTPIARFDVVPYQRIEYGTSFKLGVVAFSKAGISSVVFTPSGQGYSSGSKTATSMTLNDRTGVCEYWVSIPSSQFTGNGAITVSATVNGADGGTKSLGGISMIVEGTSSYSHVEKWADIVSGNDSTGAGTSASPYKTIGKAVSECGSDASGCIVYLKAGTGYTLVGASPTTNTEWLTIKNVAGVSSTAIIINGGGTIDTTSKLKLEGVTLLSTSQYDYVIDSGSGLLVWLDDVRVIGAGRTASGMSPVKVHQIDYVTDSYFYNMDVAVGYSVLARNVDVSTVCDDPFQQFSLLVNVTATDVDPYYAQPALYLHADGAQLFNEVRDNRIVYGYYGTNLHYQGIMMSDLTTVGYSNVAFVNVLMEMREPGRKRSATLGTQLQSALVQGKLNHVLFWNCTFPYKDFNTTDGGGNFAVTNSSFIGNVFYQYLDSYTRVGTVDPTYSLPGNSSGNVYLHNHYIASCVDGVPSSTCATLPHYYAISPDSGSSTATTGTPDWSDVWVPASSGNLVDRFTPVVPVDVFNNERVTSDVGAIEYVSGAADTDPPGALQSVIPPSSLASGTTISTLSFSVNETSNFKYGTSSPSGSTGAEKYANLPNSFSQNPARSFSLALTGLTDGSSTDYYIIGCDDESTPNCQDDVTIINVSVLTSASTCVEDNQYCLTIEECVANWPEYNWCPDDTPKCGVECTPGEDLSPGAIIGLGEGIISSGGGVFTLE